MTIFYVGVRVYRIEDGKYRAWATVQRSEGDKSEDRTESSHPKETPGEAIADALERAEFIR